MEKEEGDAEMTFASQQPLEHLLYLHKTTAFPAPPALPSQVVGLSPKANV